MEVRLAKTDDEIMGCYQTLTQLREIKKEEFLAKIKEHQESGYMLAYGADKGQVVSVAGFRFTKTLAWGKIMYVDDLITDKKQRSKGYGDSITNWLMDYAKENSCDEFHLDSAVWRYAAHRFYFRKRMEISGYHFQVGLK